MDYDVIDVRPMGPMALQVWFADGTTGLVRFEPSHLTGALEVLRDPTLFSQARIECGALTWPGDLDLSPDAMYREIKARGEWILR